jgi:poly(hydroxyalkanoate) depolymerase family esterase
MTALRSSMGEALRLTRAGRLTEATGLIRDLLGGKAGGAEPPEARDRLADQPLEVPFERVDAPKAKPKAKAGAGASTTVAGQVLEGRWTGAAGVLDYRLYLPREHRAGMPVVVMLHGCTQSAEDFARGTRMDTLADELGFVVFYPRQTQAANMQKCWNWFKPGDQERDRGEPALIAGATRQVLAEHGGDGARVYVAGLSAGGAAAAIMAARYPDLFAAVGVHSGLACGSARDLPSALSAMRSGGRAANGRGERFVPVITFHGDQDHTVNEANSREIVAAASGAAEATLTARVESGRAPGGRAYRREVSQDAQGRVLIEQWTVHGSGHAWSGGDAAGSYTDPQGPDASREMLRFFLTHSLGVSRPRS